MASLSFVRFSTTRNISVQKSFFQRSFATNSKNVKKNEPKKDPKKENKELPVEENLKKQQMEEQQSKSEFTRVEYQDTGVKSNKLPF